MKTIMLVEDEEDLREILHTHLKEKTDYKVIVAKDGVEAYQKARNQKFDMVITDFKMPKITGSDLISALRETEENENVPILLLTGVMDIAREECRAMLHISFMEKPAEIDQFIKKVKELVNFDPNKKRFRLDVDFINPFIEASMKTLNQLCAVESIKAMKPYLLNKDEVLDIDISGTLAIVSPYFRGSIAISFSNDVYRPIVSRMIEEKVENISLDNQDGAAEIINIIFGQTKAVLNKFGYEMHRAIPSVVRGKGHKIYQDSKIPVLLVPFNSDVGRFFIQICVKAI
jgi:chemotaxis protein CheX